MHAGLLLSFWSLVPERVLMGMRVSKSLNTLLLQVEGPGFGVGLLAVGPRSEI